MRAEAAGPVLVPRPPRVYLGPNAERSRTGERGILLGARRAGRVDVLEFEPRPGDGLTSLMKRRFAPPGTWDVVGVSLSSADLRARGRRLLRDLVPGDVVMTERGPRVHTGARFVATKLEGSRDSATSAR